MGCKAAIPTDEYHGWECEITEGACMFLHPDSKRCAKEYGEGPDAAKQWITDRQTSTDLKQR